MQLGEQRNGVLPAGGKARNFLSNMISYTYMLGTIRSPESFQPLVISAPLAALTVARA